MRLRRHAVGTLAVATGIALAGAIGAQAAPADQTKSWDFDGDGHRELVANAPEATVDGQASAGAVAIFGGTRNGPSTSGQKLTEGQSQVPGEPGVTDDFGRASTSGDYNGDGFADLATCTDGSENGEATGLTVAFGSERGMAEAIAVSKDGEATTDCTDLETADVNQDETDDLIKAGTDTVSFVRGDSDLTDPSAWIFVEVDEEPNEDFFELSVGDLNGDDLPDLVYATGTVDSESEEGRIQYGGPEGFTPGDTWEVDGPMATAVGDVNGDGYDELAFGNPRATVNGESGAGAVALWNGAEGGIDTGTEPASIDQGTSGAPGTPEQTDGFGSEVVLDDADGDGHAELVVGTPLEDVRDVRDAGAYVAVPGGADGPDTSRAVGVHQGSAGVPGTLEENDEFGADLDLRNLSSGDGALEVVVAAPGENGKTGRVYVMRDGDVSFFRPADADIAPQDAELGLGD